MIGVTELSRRMGYGLVLVLVLVSGAPAGAADTPKHPLVVIDTSLGAIRVELFADEAPKTVANFLDLAEGRKPFTDPRTSMPAQRPYYDGLVFHRVIKGFMIQGGDPLGTGGGGPGYQFADEINAHLLGLDDAKALEGDGLNPLCNYMRDDFIRFEIQPKMKAHGITDKTPPDERQRAGTLVMQELKTLTLKQFYSDIGYSYDETLPGAHKPVRGSLAMANSGPNTNGSQFFINLGDTPHLTGKHTVFGQVVAGLEVLDAIGAVAVGAGDRPEVPVVIKSIRSITSQPQPDAAPGTPAPPPATPAPAPAKP
jgi:cyclophilin family peptidyl-prolyl cis-trans isomerase